MGAYGEAIVAPSGKGNPRTITPAVGSLGAGAPWS